jgi:mannose-6-phosphate isomerase-like protein (cupin superfamily)
MVLAPRGVATRASAARTTFPCVSWTRKNLREVEDAAKRFGVAGGFSARFATGDLASEGIGLALETLPPGGRTPWAHRHNQAEEIYVVLSGAGRAKLDDEVVELGPLDALRIAPPVLRAFEAGDEGLELLVFGPRHQGDGELVHEDVFG